MYLTKKIYENIPEFLKGEAYQNYTCSVSDVGVQPDEYGKKIVPRGTILDKDGAAVKITRSGSSGSYTYALSSVPVGILFAGTEVTYGSQAGALMVDGSVNTERLQGEYLVEAVQQLTEAMPFIKFIVDGQLQTKKTI